MKKSLVSIFLAVAMTASVLSGCASAPAPSASGSASPTEAEPAKDVTLVVASSANWTKDIDKEIAEKFTAETGIKVEFQATPDDQYSNVLKAKLSTGEGPDIFLCQSGVGMNEFLPDKNFLDLSNEPWVSRYVDWAKSGTTYNGKIVAMNLWSADGWGLLYDPAKFEKAGVTAVPKTYEEFDAACSKLVQAGYVPVYEFGSAIWHQPLWLNAVGSTAEATNPDYLKALNDNTLKFADVPSYELALTQLKQFADKGYFGKDFMAQTWETSIDNMAADKYAMILTYTTYPNEVMAAHPNSGADKWEMFPVPFADNTKFAMSSGGVVHAINKNSKNIDAAKAYLEFRSKKENAAQFYAARTDLGSTAFNDVEGKITLAFDTVNKNSNASVLDLQTGSQFFDLTTMGKYFQELYMGTKTPKQVLEAIDSDRAKMFEAIAK
ncbi:raffinose/stachyose/melibiose transport system substrate-binding protein [Hydrogenoanaerobacterium saccharovorans]|uniref:Raffinose/stachyose/melibiose transport system substrate-binding protein n=1 Tax=Hydrogenoanaerobacterium saccharovorans TaxID=474960 RepID=A0A1H8CW36_9FIRM|nr:ABC transporter substrate-binding protein [Hydrogenoanaerobacterium saccharovorans]RPF43346.1 raffinose/stachyose/melibiose transport system substrate-binding protein [Hydrogenoanaerobacterium saccharovorans]SEM99245.1 raffinose/stachyose/melibiose transport system substrate-binding protein [Hydrogenoanaerobacterium saccharovorans]